jgi:hypothetical protein
LKISREPSEEPQCGRSPRTSLQRTEITKLYRVFQTMWKFSVDNTNMTLNIDKDLGVYEYHAKNIQKSIYT